MQLEKLDHVNIRTANLKEMVEWYGSVLGMENGERPPFSFPGAWLYAGSHPAVHLVGVEGKPSSIEPKIEHFAFTASGLKELTARLDKMGIDYRAVRVPGIDVLQINVHDCDGNHIHIDFSPQEADEAGL
ncbi:MAG: VOC family protein [Hyphomicrobiales bacterium]